MGTKPSKDLKKGLLTLAEEVQLNELGSVKEVLMMGKKKDLRGFFVSITRMSEAMMQKSEDTGTQGMLRIPHFSTNRYTRRTVRESLRFSKFVTRTTGKVLKKGGVNKPLQWLSSANAWFKKVIAKIGFAGGGNYSDQYRLKVDAGENYDREGFARIGDRYVIACTSTYGKVGDYVDFYQKDGSVLKACAR